MTKLTQIMLESLNHPLFTIHDVNHLLPGSDSSKYGRINRALKNHEIIQIRRGLYALTTNFRKTPLNVRSLAQIIYGPSYISAESALSWHGLIPEAVYTISCASYGKAKIFATPLGIYDYKPIPQKIFYAGVERLQDQYGASWFVANPLKSLLDYGYLHKVEWNSLSSVCESLRIVPDDLHIITPDMIIEPLQKGLLQEAQLQENYTNRKVQRLLSMIKRELDL